MRSTNGRTAGLWGRARRWTSQLPNSSTSDGAAAERFRRLLVEPGLVVGGESAERSETMRVRDRSDRTTVLPCSGQFAARQFQPESPQMRHWRRVAEAAEGQLQGPCADARG